MIEKILMSLGLTRYEVIKKKHGSVPQITAGEFIEVVLEYETIPKIASHFKVSVQTINRLFAKLFPDISCQGRQTWRMLILNMAELKRCIECELIKSKTEFYGDKRSLTETMSICKCCDDMKGRLKNNLAKDANILIISDIYANCPEGYHVDHIIPINKNGLHHENNLCYLPAKLNIAKSDKLPEQVPEIMEHAIYPELRS